MHYQPILTFPLFDKTMNIYLYGVFIALGLLACVFVLYFYTSKKKVPNDLQDYIFFIAILSIAIGFLMAKSFQAFYDYIETGKFDFYNAGLTVMGGIIGGATTFIITYFLIGHFLFKGKREGIHLKYFNEVLLIAPLCITIAHAFGRLGCLMSGCCHGAYLGKEYVFGGVWMRAPDTGNIGYHVPTQLYESLFLFVLFAILSILYFKRYNILMQIYLISYGVWRFLIEYVRTDQVGGVQDALLRPSQWQSIIFISIGILLFVIYHIRRVPLKQQK